ncbi:MAG: MBL fold metallo-hydrolase [Candidatus Thorarchaeota archaeon]|jgi:glyoxylase-like metal-dependent hydrolase (beta-lactamase superfamily II)
MEVEKIGSRGLLFSFKDPYLTNVYVIIGKKQIFVLDTSLGSEPMQFVRQTLEEEDLGEKTVVVFNSHGDYDHYWGNGVFDNALIIGHMYCRTRIIEESDSALRKYIDHRRGEVIIRAPSLVFFKRLEFPEEDVTFFYTPGHTIDSASCYDEVDKIVFVGDNVESPLPYVYNTNLAQFSETLKSYRDMDWNVMIASHDPPLHDRILLEKNIEYISNLHDWNIDLSTFSEDDLHLHNHNICFLEKNIDKSKLSPEAKSHISEMRKAGHH